MKIFFMCSKKSVRSFKLRIEPYFLSHAERGEYLQNQDFVGGMQNRRRFAPTIFLVQKPFSKNCGEGEIRTPEALRPAAFRKRYVRPLRHLSSPETLAFFAKMLKKSYYIWVFSEA